MDQNQKRFLTAGEVFQVFGVDAEALNALVESGDVTALPDRGSFKYRSEDFLRLVQGGKLSPRTAGEMFEVDSKGDVPFLKIKTDDPGMKMDENVSFIELDEDALNDQASQNATTPQTPVIPENWFDDLAESEPGFKGSDTQDEIDISDRRPVTHEEATEYELKIGEKHESDSDVKVLNDDASIDYNEPEVAPSASDSDVRLEGPISSAGMPAFNPKQPADSDSDVRISASKSHKSDSDVHVVKNKSSSDSDSDVRVAKDLSESDSDVRIAKSAKGKPDSDSDVRIAKPTLGPADSDSDVKIVAPGAALGKTASKDSDSDVSLTDAVGTSAIDDGNKTDSDIRLDASSAATSPSPVPAGASAGDSIYDDDSGITLDSSDSGISLDSGDSGISLTSGDRRAPVQSAETDSDMAIQSDEDSGIAMESVHDSGISLESATDDSGISMESATSDSGISLEGSSSDSGISLDAPDSGISVEAGKPDSGISLDAGKTDSGISLDAGKPDSGIMLDAGDSGIGLDTAGSRGNRLAKTDSGIAMVDDKSDPSATLSDLEINTGDSGHTQTLELSGEHGHDSGFDVSLAEGDRTMEMSLDDSSADADATVLQKGRSKREAESLSEAFDLDDSVEVEDLDISQDLEEVPEADYSGEFAEADEEVLEASDQDFSAGEISVAEEEESDEYAPVAKVRAAPREPEWGMMAVAPIILASVMMLVTVTVLWGGIATMWSGGEAPAPAGTLISTLAGLI